MKLKTVALTGVLSLAGLGLVGAGAHAVFTATTTSAQTITAGTLSVAVSSPGATCTAWDSFDQCTAITLPAAGPVGSVFDTTPTVITLTNTGTIPAYYKNETISQTNTNSTFESEIGFCEYGTGGTAVGAYVGVDWNGLLSSALGTTDVSGDLGGYATNPNSFILQPGATGTYSVDFFAGEASSVCGTGKGLWQVPPTPVASLTNGAEGGSVTVTISYSVTDQPPS